MDDCFSGASHRLFFEVRSLFRHIRAFFVAGSLACGWILFIATYVSDFS